MVTVNIADPELAQAVQAPGDLSEDHRQALLALCRKEVDAFDRHLRVHGGVYANGLAPFERNVLEGFIYQKARGRLDEGKKPADGLPG
jgi:hypothetical protein